MGCVGVWVVGCVLLMVGGIGRIMKVGAESCASVLIVADPGVSDVLLGSDSPCCWDLAPRTEWGSVHVLTGFVPTQAGTLPG